MIVMNHEKCEGEAHTQNYIYLHKKKASKQEEANKG